MNRSSHDHRLGRRELLRTWAPALLAGAAAAVLGGFLSGRPGRHRRAPALAASRPPDWRVAPHLPGRIAIASGGGPPANLRRALDAVGGIGRFVRPGERVVIKPNCAWDRTPEQAANTNPELIGELVRLCLGSGAAAVVVADNTCNDPERVFARSGIAAAARDAGARVAHQSNVATVPVDLGGTVLGTWQVLRPIADAHRVINVPLVKHHSLCHATLGMKNWFGAIVGRRASLHQRVHQVCAELGAALHPTLTVMDATRALVAGGPTGGSLDLVRPFDQIAVATDPVAIDAWAGELLGIGGRELRYLDIAVRLGLGTADWRSIVTEG
jgi:uncharacterized protein (DUF362 family)